MPVRCTGKEKYVYIPYCRNTIAPAITITGRVEQKKCETDNEVVLHLDTLCAASIRLNDEFWIAMVIPSWSLHDGKEAVQINIY
jgi:hypothetical protein